MTNLLTFLSAVFYVDLAVIMAVSIIDERRTARRPTTELAQETRLQKAA